MTAGADHRIWQDVYYVPSPVGTLYVKFTADAVSESLLLSFKERRLCSLQIPTGGLGFRSHNAQGSTMTTSPALIGRAGEALVAGEILRRGVEVAYPASDVGIDLLAYRLAPEQTMAAKFVPIQVKARAKTGYNFQRDWFDRVPGVVLVHVWNIETVPEFYVLENLDRVMEALGAVYATSPSWSIKGGYNVTKPNQDTLDRMKAHKDKWERITDQLLLP